MNSESSSEDQLETISQGILYPAWYQLFIPKLIEPVVILDDFLESHTHLFTLIGIFAALTIYFESTIDSIGTPEYLNDVIFTGFSIVTLLSFLVFAKIVIEVYESQRIWRSYENIGLYAFIFLYSQIAVRFAGILLQFEQILNLHIAVLVYLTSQILGFGFGFVVFTVPYRIAERLPRFKKPAIIILFTVILFISGSWANRLSTQLPTPDSPTLLSLSELVQIATLLFSSGFFLVLLIGILITYILALWWLLKSIWSFLERLVLEGTRFHRR